MSNIYIPNAPRELAKRWGGVTDTETAQQWKRECTTAAVLNDYLEHKEVDPPSAFLSPAASLLETTLKTRTDLTEKEVNGLKLAQEAEVVVKKRFQTFTNKRILGLDMVRFSPYDIDQLVLQTLPALFNGLDDIRLPFPIYEMTRRVGKIATVSTGNPNILDILNIPNKWTKRNKNSANDGAIFSNENRSAYVNESLTSSISSLKPNSLKLQYEIHYYGWNPTKTWATGMEIRFDRDGKRTLESAWFSVGTPLKNGKDLDCSVAFVSVPDTDVLGIRINKDEETIII